jgi:DNA invertase Pin-like site-specific DNA recombinase
LRKERQLEGIAKAKAEGVYKGRKPSVPADEIREMHRQGQGPRAIAEALGVSRMSVWRALNAGA